MDDLQLSPEDRDFMASIDAAMDSLNGLVAFAVRHWVAIGAGITLGMLVLTFAR